jgi:DUF4097 and DUF4098 domain-containing protein YvlB
MKASRISIIISAAVIAAILLLTAYAIVNNAIAPPAQRQDKTLYTPKANVEVNAATFNGNIEIQTTTGNQIEVIYNLEASQSHLNYITTSTNETKSDNATTLITSANYVGEETSAIHTADLLIKLPNTSRYNLTLTTLTGDITKPQLNDSKVVATTSNGNINLKGDNCTELDAMSMNGNVKIGLAKGTLFQVAASVGNGIVSYHGIALDTSVQTVTRLKGATSLGEGNLTLTLLAGNGNITIEYLTD